MPRKTFGKMEITSGETQMDRLSQAFEDEHRSICAQAGLSPWEYIVAMANAGARILAQSQNMPEDHAMKRITDLRAVMEQAYLNERARNQKDGVA